MSNNVMKTLIEKLNYASDMYYNTDHPIMTDQEYDILLETLKAMEEETGIIMSNSPTNKVGANVLTELKKVKIEEKPMLSLDKVHSSEEVYSFAKGKKLLGLIKCDGLSTRLIYKNGKLFSANTRGNGYEGSDVTEHIKTFQNVPLTINTNKTYIVDGESIIKEQDFKTLSGFKNTRNAASGALSLLDVQEVKKRKLSFIAWDIIQGEEDEDSIEEKLFHAMKYGFEIVSGVEISSKDLTKEKIEEGNNIVLQKAKQAGIPCDGVVWRYDSSSYGNSLGATAHHFNNGIAWKPKIETAETQLKDIEWTMGRTGQLTPVAIVEPVELDGSTIARASLHNLSVLKDTLHCGGWSGQHLHIAKMNMIIPQIVAAEYDDDNLFNHLKYPTKCPICGELTIIKKENDSEFLYCNNPMCQGKLINVLDHFCGKKGLDIKGLSKATLEKLIDWSWVSSCKDIFTLKDHYNEWIKKSGFGIKSVERILTSIENAQNTTFEKIISAAGIPLVGITIAKELTKYFTSYLDFRQHILDKKGFIQFNGFGLAISNNLMDFDYKELDYIVENYIKFQNANNETKIQKLLDNKTFCITGKLSHFKNRDELKSQIEAYGGKVVSSISSKVNYLINNDIQSTSSKNITAKKLNVPIITEQDYLSLIEK